MTFFQLKLLLSPVCGIPSSSAPSTVLLLPNSVVTLSSNMVVNNVNLTHSISWSLLRKRGNSTAAFPQAGMLPGCSTLQWGVLEYGPVLPLQSCNSCQVVRCFCTWFFWTRLIYGESVCGNQPQISSQGSRTVLNCGTSRRYIRELVYRWSQHKDHTALLENSLNVSPCVFLQMEFILLETPAVGTSGTS